MYLYGFVSSKSARSGESCCYANRWEVALFAWSVGSHVHTMCLFVFRHFDRAKADAIMRFPSSY